ncbi:MAG: hypothetical protein J0H77_19095 [Alphaproteobacteria bacterium]|jgi:hypothetical protein|nr:hypothetical protein [Alphaproteobacteria bacterium]
MSGTPFLGGPSRRSTREQVAQACPALPGGITCSGEPDSIRFRPLFADRPANMPWVNMSGKTYVLTYNHETEKVEIRDRTQRPPCCTRSTTPIRLPTRRSCLAL